jgi:arylsulfatase A-like enzyme
MAPTILALMGLAIPPDLDGRALDDLLAAPSGRAALKPAEAKASAETERTSGYTDEEAAQVAARLRALGYLE